MDDTSMLERFNGETKEFIQNVTGSSLGKSSEELKLKDVKQEIGGNTVAIDMLDLLGEKAERFFQEDVSRSSLEKWYITDQNTSRVDKELVASKYFFDIPSLVAKRLH